MNCPDAHQSQNFEAIAPIAELARLTRTRDPHAASSPSNELEELLHAPAARTLDDEFAELVEPLEAVAGQPLKGPARQKCLAAFGESRDGVARLVDDLLGRQGVRNALGLLYRMVEDGDHRLPPPPPAPPGASVVLPSRVPPPPCPDCSIGAGQHADGCKLAGSRNREAAAE